MLNQGVLRRLTASARGGRLRAGAGSEPRTRGAALRWSGVWAVARPVAVALLSAVAVLLLLDWVVFQTPAVLPRMPTYRNDGSPNDKLLLAARYPDSKVLFLGDSRVRYGIDPDIVSRKCQCGPGFNAGFPGADVRLNRLMAERLLERMSPNLVVISVSQWELSDKADVHVGEGSRELVPISRRAEYGMETNIPEDIPQLIGGVWQFYKYRGELRQSLEVWAGGDRREEPRRGYKPYEGRAELDEDDLERREDQWFDDFSVEGRRAQALRGLIDDLQARGIRVVLLAPPLLPEFQQDVGRPIARFRAAIAKLADEEGVQLIDATASERIGIDEDRFRDVVHLDEEGSEQYSAFVGEKLRTGQDKR